LAPEAEEDGAGRDVQVAPRAPPLEHPVEAAGQQADGSVDRDLEGDEARREHKELNADVARVRIDELRQDAMLNSAIFGLRRFVSRPRR
jgi:hypothetical protein